MCFVLCEMNQVHSIFFAIEGSFLSSLFAVINNDLIIFTACYYVHSIITVVDIGYLILVVVVKLSHTHRADDIVHQLHERHVQPLRQPKAA